MLGETAAERFCYVYDVSDDGNFEGSSILNLPKTIEQCASLRGWDVDELQAELTESRRKLLEVRDGRVRPGKDDKILVSWNALMIDALARAAGIFAEPQYLRAARRAAEFLLRQLRREDGRLLHSWRHGKPQFDAYLDDYTYLINALVSLYEADFDERWIDEAVQLADLVNEHFADGEQGGFFYTADDHEQLIARHKDWQDSSVPSGNSMAATALWRLAKLCGRDDYAQAAQQTLAAGLWLIQQSPTAAGQLLIALDMYEGPFHEIAILGDLQDDDTAAALADLRSRYLPNRVVACRSAADASQAGHLQPLFAGKQPLDLQPSVFVCENFACQAPVSGKQQVCEAWQRLANAS